MQARRVLHKLVPRSSRTRAALLALAAVLAFALAFLVGNSSADSTAPLRSAKPLVTHAQEVEIRGLPAARALPGLRPPPPPPPPPPAPRRPAPPRPVVIVGEG